MAIDNLHNLPSNKKDYEYINVPENPIHYLSAAEYNHLVETLKEFIDDYNIKMSGNAPSQDIPIITTGDVISTPTDESVFSSLRTLAEIYNSLEGVNSLYLSRKKDDTAEGNIKFNENVFGRIKENHKKVFGTTDEQYEAIEKWLEKFKIE